MTVRLRSLSLVLAILVMAPAVSAAQSEPSITFGIKGGVNSAAVSTDVETDRRLGGVGGVFVGARITDTIGLQFEGLFSQRGATDDSAGFKLEYRSHYIDVPVLLVLGSSTDSDMQFRVFGGPMASYKLKAEASAPSLGLTEDLDDEVEDLDFSGVVGVGVAMGRVSVDARYSHGFTNFSTTAGETAKNRTFAVMVGLRLK
ncbi:MAG: PorT family protein [Acidobacteria bacterium]|jgi:opacity protein-like surface antigen|nr:PorT family protein [Acidobacteriota bacterium]